MKKEEYYKKYRARCCGILLFWRVLWYNILKICKEYAFYC